MITSSAQAAYHQTRADELTPPDARVMLDLCEAERSAAVLLAITVDEWDKHERIELYSRVLADNLAKYRAAGVAVDAAKASA